MKTKLLIVFLIALVFTGCSVDPLEEEIRQEQIIPVNAELNEPGCAGPDNSKQIELTQAKSIESWDDCRKLFLSLLDAEVSRNGTFSPSIDDIIDSFNESENYLGFYTTTYSLDTQDCMDSVELTIEVIPDGAPEGEAPLCEASAGPDATGTIEISDAEAIGSWDEVRKLFLSLLKPGVSRNGSFSPSIDNIIDAFNSVDPPLGEYTTTYTIQEGDCSDSVLLTIIVIPDIRVDEPVCELDAGNNNLKELTYSQAAAIESWDQVRKLYLSLLDNGVPRDGEFSPSIDNIIKAFNSNEEPLGDYTTTYTISDGECSDTVELTIRVVAD